MRELRSPKIVYDVLNVSGPSLKGAVSVVIVVGSWREECPSPTMEICVQLDRRSLR